jgi:HAMP domain-containing protein
MKAVTEIFRRLRFKVSSLILAILVLGFGILVILNISRETELLIAENLKTARLLAASSQVSIDNGMLEARPDIISGLVQNLKAELKDVRRLEVYRRNGVEAFSDFATLNEVHAIMGLDPDLYARIAKMHRVAGKKISDPLFERAVETVTPQENYEATDNGRLLTLYRPLENRKECQDCHGDDHKVRGIVRVSLGLEKLDADLRAARNRQIVVVILTIIGVTGTLLVFMGRVVLRPIAHVVGTARQIGSGDFAARVDVKNQDEIGELGRAINEMAGRLSSAHANLEARNAELATTLQNLQESLRR